ncbi:hypothetical protein AB1N83_004263 [Pleurotus pulmonarius]
MGARISLLSSFFPQSSPCNAVFYTIYHRFIHLQVYLWLCRSWTKDWSIQYRRQTEDMIGNTSNSVRFLKSSASFLPDQSSLSFAGCCDDSKLTSTKEQALWQTGKFRSMSSRPQYQSWAAVGGSATDLSEAYIIFVICPSYR